MSQHDAGRLLVELLPRLRRFALVLARSADAADELVQASVERALSRLDQCEPGSRLDRWMFQIMKTVWLNSQRAAAIRRTDVLDDEGADQVIDGSAAAEAKLTFGEVRAAFERLPLEQRQALFLVSVEGYTYGETAALLDVPIGTVVSRLARGRAALIAEASGMPTNIAYLRRKGG